MYIERVEGNTDVPLYPLFYFTLSNVTVNRIINKLMKRTKRNKLTFGDLD